jgi:hypothetical protein
LRWVDSSSSQPFATEWTIETFGGKTLLRLVQSSFEAGASWDQEFYDSTNYGWTFMLVNLRHYLERHAGQPRRVAWPRHMAGMPPEVIYKKLAAPHGIFVEGAQGALRAGELYSLRTATAEGWTGRVEFVVPPRGFRVTVESLNDALAWLTIEGAGPTFEAQLWFSIYGIARSEVDALEARWSKALERILG